jgi:hypothetical protein
MRIALDTSRLADLFRGDGRLAASLEGCSEVWIALIVQREIKARDRRFDLIPQIPRA